MVKKQNLLYSASCEKEQLRLKEKLIAIQYLKGEKLSIQIKWLSFPDTTQEIPKFCTAGHKVKTAVRRICLPEGLTTVCL